GGCGITNSLKEKERPQSDKQRWKAKQCDKNTVQRADKYSAYDGGEERETASHHWRETEKSQGPNSRDRSNGDIDFTRRDDDCLSKRHNRQDRSDLRYGLQVANRDPPPLGYNRKGHGNQNHKADCDSFRMSAYGISNGRTHATFGPFAGGRPPSRIIPSNASALIASRGTSVTLRPFSRITIRSAIR